MSTQMVEEFFVLPRKRITIDCEKYLEAHPGSQLDIEIVMSSHPERVKIRTETKEVHGHKVPVYNVRNGSSSPPLLKLEKIT